MSSLRSYKRKPRFIEFIPTTSEQVVEFASKFSGMEAPALCDGNTYLIRTGGEVVALVSYIVTGHELLLTQLYVLPSHRGFGIGTEIIDLLCHLEPVETLRVLATPSSFAFYENLGFRQEVGCVVLSKEVLI